jgi:hypothetical protein
MCGLLNLTFLRQVERTVRRAFQERRIWIWPKGKVGDIVLAAARPRHSATG